MGCTSPKSSPVVRKCILRSSYHEILIRKSDSCFFFKKVTRHCCRKFSVIFHLYMSCCSLNNCCINYFRQIKAFLREQTGLDYEIHIIQEAAGRGSILSTEERQVKHDRSAPGEEDLHLPLGYVSYLFAYHYAENWKVGNMMNCPGDCNAKIANYVSNCKLFLFLLLVTNVTIFF